MEDNTKQLSSYFKENLDKGILEEDLRKASLVQGWNEADINKALELAKINTPLPPTPNPTVSNVPVPPSSSTSAGQIPPNTTGYTPINGNSVDSLMKNHKFIETVKTVAIYGAIFTLINYIVGFYSRSIFLTRYYGSYKFTIPFANFIQFAISAAIGGVIGGVLFYFFYDPIKNWVKGSAFLSKHMHNMFTLFWKPTLFFTVIGFLLSFLPILATIFVSSKLFLNIVVTSVVQLVVYYLYSKKLSEKLEQYYPW
jgi:hypothetical protein